MTGSRSFIPLTQEQRDRKQEQKQERYSAMYAEVEQQMRAEYEAEFGDAYREKHPFTPDGAVIHQTTLQKLREQGYDNDE